MADKTQEELDMLNETHDGSAPDTRGLPPGVLPEHLDDSQTRTGNPAPEVINTPPAKDPTPEEKAAKEAADKKAADEAAAKVAEEAAKKKADEEASKDELEYPVYNDPSADAVVELLKEANVTPKECVDIFKDVSTTGDFDKVDRTALVAKLGETKATLVIATAKEYFSREKGKVDLVVNEVYKVVGNKANFDVVRDWALGKEKVDPAFAKDLNSYRVMLESTPTQARLAAEALLKAYKADPNTKALEIKMIDGDKPASNASLEPISRADYINALEIAEKAGDKAKIAELNARRSATIKSGR